MSGISNYTLNQKINAVLGKTSGIPSVIDLDTTLTTGNNAGANDIDMNNQDILNVDNIDLTTINGSAYPPTTSSANTTLEDFDTDTNTASTLGFNIRFNETGSGSSTYFTASNLSAPYVAGAVGRVGLIQLNSGGSSGQETMLFTDTIYSIANIEQVIIGFIPLGNANFTSTGGSASNVRQHFGISATTQQVGNATTNSILWRLEGGGFIPTWEFVINNVVQYTTTLGDLTGKWCRATFDITEPSAGNYSVSTTLVNLTDGTTETTSAFPLVSADFSNFAPQTQRLLMVSGTQNSNNKYFGVDYVQTKLKLYPIGGGDTLAFR